MIVIDNYMLGI